MKNEIILSLDNIHKAFHGNEVHRGVSLNLHQGETLGLLGNSGTGKSVLLRSIIGLEYIDQGEVKFYENRLDNLKEIELFKFRTKISYAFQNGALFDSINVFENIAYPLIEHTKLTMPEIEAKVEDLLKLIGLAGKGHLMPSDLSGGMQKRVGLARAIVLKPEVILYDEPTAGLDPENTINILKIMEGFKNQGISGIFVTHDIAAAIKVCDRIAILKDGKIYFNGTPTEFSNSEDSFVQKFFTLSSDNKREKQ
ncbi:MAG: ABC transporter ATP-binding protein [Bacteriovoracaceae bacterium]